MPPKSSSAKRTKTTCKSCDKAAIAGNYGFCDDHRVRVARAGASNNEAQPVIINLVDENPGSANLATAPVDLLEPSSELFPPGAGTVHEPVPTAAQQQHLSQRLGVRVAGSDENQRYTLLPNVRVVGAQSQHLSPDMLASNVAQSLANIGGHRPNQNFIGRVHQALSNRDMVVPAVSLGSELGNLLPPLQQPEVPTPSPSAPPPTTAPRPSLREVLLRNTTPEAQRGDLNSMWREGVDDMPRPTVGNPNLKVSRAP